MVLQVEEGSIMALGTTVLFMILLSRPASYILVGIPFLVKWVTVGSELEYEDYYDKYKLHVDRVTFMLIILIIVMTAITIITSQ